MWNSFNNRWSRRFAKLFPAPVIGFPEAEREEPFESGVLEKSPKCVESGDDGKEPLKSAEHERGTKTEE